MAVLSIQSSVALGHVGNSTAVFALQRLGIEVWPVHTVQLSNHTAHPDWGGGALGAAHISDVLEGVHRRTGSVGVDAVLTGYVGSVDLVPVIVRAVKRVKAASPAALYCCDPVMGNARRGLYVAEDVADAIACHLVPLADIVTPNAFELARLADRPAATTVQAGRACTHLQADGPDMVVVTSLDTPEGVGVLASNSDDCWLVKTPRLPVSGNGAGDTLAALLLGHLLRGTTLAEATSRAVSSTYALLAAGTADSIALISKQNEIASPQRLFPAETLSSLGG